jgi:hypothetical protein
LQEGAEIRHFVAWRAQDAEQAAGIAGALAEAGRVDARLSKNPAKHRAPLFWRAKPAKA